MKLIHKVEDCAVYNKGDDKGSANSDEKTSLTYMLKIPSSAELIRALKDVGTVKRIITNTSDTLKFKATRVESLKQFIEKINDKNNNTNGMTYTLVLKLLADIGTLLQYIMHEYSRAIPFFSLEDIIVIENEDNENSVTTTTFDFVFINGEKLLHIGDGGAKRELRVDVPLQVNKQSSFLPLELAESALKRLPIMNLTTTSWLYSLSSLCIYVLLNYKFKNGEDDIERIGRPFLHTSLYFCLKRCMKTNPEKRILLYV